MKLRRDPTPRTNLTDGVVQRGWSWGLLASMWLFVNTQEFLFLFFVFFYFLCHAIIDLSQRSIRQLKRVFSGQSCAFWAFLQRGGRSRQYLTTVKPPKMGENRREYASSINDEVKNPHRPISKTSQPISIKFSALLQTTYAVSWVV